MLVEDRPKDKRSRAMRSIVSAVKGWRVEAVHLVASDFKRTSSRSRTSARKLGEKENATGGHSQREH